MQITFNDRYRDNDEVTDPILKQVDLPAVMFLTTDFLDMRRVAIEPGIQPQELKAVVQITRFFTR